MSIFDTINLSLTDEDRNKMRYIGIHTWGLAIADDFRDDDYASVIFNCVVSYFVIPWTLHKAGCKILLANENRSESIDLEKLNPKMDSKFPFNKPEPAESDTPSYTITLDCQTIAMIQLLLAKHYEDSQEILLIHALRFHYICTRAAFGKKRKKPRDLVLLCQTPTEDVQVLCEWSSAITI